MLLTLFLRKKLLAQYIASKKRKILPANHKLHKLKPERNQLKPPLLIYNCVVQYEYCACHPQEAKFT